MRLLQVRGLSKRFDGQLVLDGISFELHEGECVVLRGSNGSGKTTLLNILSGLVQPDEGRLSADGSVFEYVGGKCLNERLSQTRLAMRGVTRSWQDVRLFRSLSLVDNLNVAAPDQLGERLLPPLLQSRSVIAAEGTVRTRSVDLLARFGITGITGPLLVKPGESVSLGESKRVAIARACRASSRVLLLDEPLSGLDAGGISAVVRLLERLTREERIGLIVVEHETTVHHLSEVASQTWWLANGRLTGGPPHDRPGSESAQFFSNWLGRASSGVLVQRSTLPNGARLSIAAPAAASMVPPSLEVNSVVLKRQGRAIAPPLSFSLPHGSLAVLEAPNGWGKTSLADTLTGALPLGGGHVAMEGRVLDDLKPWTRRRAGLSLLQSRSSFFPGLTVADALKSVGAGVPESLARFRHRVVSSLSGGERQRVLLAAAQGGPPVKVSVWDEPYLGLDESGLVDLFDLVKTRPDGQAVLVLVPGTVA